MGTADYKRKLKDLIKRAESAGWLVTKTGGGHWRFVPSDKTKQIVHAAATSSDYRGISNIEADLRRSGLTV